MVARGRVVFERGKERLQRDIKNIWGGDGHYLACGNGITDICCVKNWPLQHGSSLNVH